jgi:metal transporter CNNM
MATTSRGYMRSHNSPHNSFSAFRSGALGLAKVLFLAASQSSSAIASPIKRSLEGSDDDLPKDLDDPDLWLYMGIATVLVLLGGAFAGLTIA